ncbi:MAG: glycoside hydrolase, partial [Myxococcota bacterium]|nr:glycoside hydrolase [Myxococcota bacterium]
MRNTVHLAFIWHMHQPPYAVEDDEPRLPWVRLHALRAYYDMAWMLERHPKVRCAVNLSACLIEQLRALVEDGVRDRWFRL